MAKIIRPYILAESNWKAVKDTNYTVAILPWGATEAHNYHLPYATDNFQAEYVTIAAAEQAWRKGAKVVVLPTVPFGVNTGQMDITMCLNMSPSTQYAVLRDLVEVLDEQNIQKLVIVNGHGGNHFKQMIRELSLEFPEVFVCALNWYQAADPKNYFNEPGDHAGELETSAMLHIAPHLVLPLEEAGSGSAKQFKIKGLKEGWVSSQRQWTQVSEDTGVGNPILATAKKGKAYLDLVVQNIAEFLEELHHADVNNMYE
ncbi:creatininase family protein [Gelidibacter salicanalis]|uniref:Creatininase family protein n=1 Tax=Gelidibacter salicanalis TaxID=291193 RepID=A0A5C7ATC8_9FLAO|nr:creatininase family protein [Gelidibacter salicanalis]TXE09102.1 creatininase family protein [Gelidibacter salicanalis]